MLPTECGRTLQEPSGEFSSQDYLTNDTEATAAVCEWRITGTLGERLRLNFTDFQLLPGDDCEQDYLEIRDGYWHKSPILGMFESVLRFLIRKPLTLTKRDPSSTTPTAKYCGKHAPPSLVLTSGYRMLITYKLSGKVRHRGFKASYEGDCLSL